MRKKLCFIAFFLMASESTAPLKTAMAAGQKRLTPASGSKLMRRVIQLDPIPDRYIEIPGPQATPTPPRAYGQNIWLKLIDRLERTDDYALVERTNNVKQGELAIESSALSAISDNSVPPDPCLTSDGPIASSKITAKINELSFSTGSRGTRAAYGFSQGRESPYNAGVDPAKVNEFKQDSFTGQFEDSWTIHAGLDLGNEFNFDFLLAGAKLQRSEYHASIGLDLTLDNKFGKQAHRQLTVQGSGYYYDLSTHFFALGGDFEIGVGIARRDAMARAFEHLIDAVTASIGGDVAQMPLLVHLNPSCGGEPYVSAGADFRIPVGQRFYDRTQWESGTNPAVVMVEQVYQRSSRVTVVSGALANSSSDEWQSLQSGAMPPKHIVMLSAALNSAPTADVVSQPQPLNAGRADYPRADALSGYDENVFERFFDGLRDLFTLPYRIYRYLQYDQKYGGADLWRIDQGTAQRLSGSSWALQSIGMPLVWQPQAQCDDDPASANSCDKLLGSSAVSIAVIDTGIDYNHPELRRSIFWDSEANSPGWDFFSGDERAYDDHSHGTEIASVIAGGGLKMIGVAPGAVLMPVKAFSPYGATTSSAIYAAFAYSVAKGAKIIVIGWSTPTLSQAMEDGIALAEANGVLVVVAAGDQAASLDQKQYYPASFASAHANMIVVSGYDEQGLLLRGQNSGANYGSLVDMAAPASNITTADPRNSYGTHSYTGLAAGFVAGGAALALSQCPQKATVALVKSALLDGAAELASLRGEVSGNRVLNIPTALARMNTACLNSSQ